MNTKYLALIRSTFTSARFHFSSFPMLQFSLVPASNNLTWNSPQCSDNDFSTCSPLLLFLVPSPVAAARAPQCLYARRLFTRTYTHQWPLLDWFAFSLPFITPSPLYTHPAMFFSSAQRNKFNCCLHEASLLGHWLRTRRPLSSVARGGAAWPPWHQVSHLTLDSSKPVRLFFWNTGCWMGWWWNSNGHVYYQEFVLITSFLMWS